MHLNRNPTPNGILYENHLQIPLINELIMSNLVWHFNTAWASKETIKPLKIKVFYLFFYLFLTLFGIVWFGLILGIWCARLESNQRPLASEANTLSTELRAQQHWKHWFSYFSHSTCASYMVSWRASMRTQRNPHKYKHTVRASFIIRHSCFTL